MSALLDMGVPLGRVCKSAAGRQERRSSDGRNRIQVALSLEIGR